MTKHFTLLFLFIVTICVSIAKDSFEIIPIDISSLNSTTSKSMIPNFRFNEKDYLVIKPEKNSSNHILDNDLNIQTYLGNGYYLVTTTSSQSSTLLNKLKIDKIGFIKSEDKIEISVRNSSDLAQPIIVSYTTDITNEMLNTIAAQIGFSIISIDEKNHHFRTFANKNQLDDLSKLPFVFFISKYYDKKNPLIISANQLCNVNEVENVSPNGYNLKGENVNIGIWDDGTPGNNIELPPNKNIVVDKYYSSNASAAHPTYVGGCIAASGLQYPTLKGLAPKTTLYYYDIANDIVDEIHQAKLNYNINISNHSYNFSGTNCYQSGMYLVESADLDKLANQDQTLLPVVAVGNTASTCSASDTFSSIDIGFQGCKNAITVGWLFYDKKIVGNSGRGPTMDGRLKPELVAKGFNVTTTGLNNSFGSVFGSSFAAPQVAALAGLIQQKYTQQFGVAPSAALIKSVLFNTAHDLGNIGPDYTFGFGLPNINKAIYSITNNQFFEDNITNNAVKTYSISVPNGLYKLNALLSWTDKEGNPLATNTIVNNLDFKLVAPNGDTILPWILNPSLYKRNATKGIDKINTNEQITIDNPTQGNYTLVVKGTNVPFGPQNFALSYFYQNKEIEITYPNGGEILDATAAYAIRWNSNGFDSLALIELSIDNGSTWNTIASNRPLSTQILDFTTPFTASNQCLIRITSGNNIAISKQNFTISKQLNYNLLNATTCDKTAVISWASVVGVSDYKVFLLKDSEWVLQGQTSGTSFTISNLENGKTYYYTVGIINNGIVSNQSLSKTFTTTNTPCTTTNDLGVYEINGRKIGRFFTGFNFPVAHKLSFIIKNYGVNTQNAINVSYTINGSTVRTVTSNQIITANDTAIVSFLVNENLSALGNYNILAWTTLAGDVNPKNDTLKFTLKQLPNSPITLPFEESFENSNEDLFSPNYGLNGLLYADFVNEFGGRFRSNEGVLYANNGSHAITLDNFTNVAPAKTNELIFTFNMQKYLADSIVYLDFSYLNRGEVDANDKIFARGADNRSWIEIYDLFTNRDNPGMYKNVKGINLYKLLKVNNGQSLSTSFQIKIVQNGTKNGITPYENGGYSFDDIKLYTVGTDVAIVDATVKKVNCSKTFADIPISISIVNNSNQVINSIPVSYQIDNNTIVNEIVNITLNPYDTIQYTFTTKFNQSTPGKYNLKIWANIANDKYKLNDSIYNVNLFVMKTIDSFPYYNDFEISNGNIFSEGINNSWIWGTPNKLNMSNAAQENKAWTTGLVNGYNYNENSYLYLGCLDLSKLTKDPLLSFHFFTSMQQQSDSAYVEYSTNGTKWERLGCYNCGLNWYNGFNSKPYWDKVIFPWQTAHIKIPLANLTDSSNFIYRVRLFSDDYGRSEGVGIDDIHIMKDYQEIATNDSTYITQQSLGNGWMQFLRNGKLIAELYDDNKNLGNVILGYEANLIKNKTYQNKNLLKRNWVVKPQNPIVGNYTIRLYLLNSEYTNFILNEDSIKRMGDIGLIRYLGLNTNLDISDNHVKFNYKYFSPSQIQFIPYNEGYYVEFKTDTLGEFYLISTKPDEDAIANININNFSVVALDDDAYLEWTTIQEINSKEFVIQYSFDGQNFIDVDTVPAGDFSNALTNYNFLHFLNSAGGIFYYRIKIVDNTNKVTYTQIDSVYFSPKVGIVNNNTSQINAFIANNDVMVAFKNKLQEDAKISIYNTEGKLLFTKNTTLKNGINPLQIQQLQHWSKAIYYLQIQTPSQNYYSKLLKQ